MKSSFLELDPRTLIPADDNPQKMPPAVYKALKATIAADNSLIDTPAVWKDGDSYRIISGHHRVKALVENGVESEIFKVFDDPEIDEVWYRRRVLSVNRTHGEPDEDALRTFIHNSLGLDGVERESFFEHLGFNYTEINAYTADMDEDDLHQATKGFDNIDADNKDVAANEEAAKKNVKTVYLFFPVASYPGFMKKCADLMQLRGNASMTDVVDEAVSYMHSREVGQ